MPGVAVVEAGVVIVIVTTIADGVGVGDGVVGGLGRNGAVAPGIIQILGNQSAGQVINAYHIAQRIAVEIVAFGGALVCILPFLPSTVKEKPPRLLIWEAKFYRLCMSWLV